jgi:methionyl-tRNA synthetase
MDGYRNADATDAVMTLCKRCNKYIDETAPWVLAKDEAQKDRLEAVLYNLCECIRLVASLLTPLLPDTAAAIFAQLQVNEDLQGVDAAVFGKADAFAVGTPTPLFARLDVEKTLAEIYAAQQAQAAEEAAPAVENVAFLPQIAFDDFMKVDLRVAKIDACEPIPKAKKLLKLTLDDGSGTPRTVCSGIAKWYKPEDLIGKSVILVANLKPAVLCGVESQGMILAADCKGSEDIKVLFVDGVPAGSTVR